MPLLVRPLDKEELSSEAFLIVLVSSGTVHDIYCIRAYSDAKLRFNKHASEWFDDYKETNVLLYRQFVDEDDCIRVSLICDLYQIYRDCKEDKNTWRQIIYEVWERESFHNSNIPAEIPPLNITNVLNH